MRGDRGGSVGEGQVQRSSEAPRNIGQRNCCTVGNAGWLAQDKRLVGGAIGSENSSKGK